MRNMELGCGSIVELEERAGLDLIRHLQRLRVGRAVRDDAVQTVAQCRSSLLSACCLNSLAIRNSLGQNFSRLFHCSEL